MEKKVDNRVPCKYGVNCYQKNEIHLNKYKHEDKRKSQENSSSSEVKKAKIGYEAPQPTNSEAIPPESNEQLMPASPENVKENIKQKFLVDMPEDFYSFWEFCKSLNTSKPSAALISCGLTLVGPFDVLSGDLCQGNYTASQYLCHWRYFYDPPEFQTVLKGDDKSQFHMGYFRDSPSDLPTFVGCNHAAENCVIKVLGLNLFSAVNSHLTTLLKTADPFQRIKLKKVHGSLQAWATKNSFSLTDSSTASARKHKAVCLTFHKAGIVVPYDKKTTVGYRELEDEGTLRKLLARIADAESESQKESENEKLHTLINFANIANDECDFGAGLELGINLFCSGHEIFHVATLGILRPTYSLLQRGDFIKILEAHLQDRKKGVDLGIIKHQK